MSGKIEKETVGRFITAMWSIAEPADTAQVFGLVNESSEVTKSVCQEIWESWCQLLTTPDRVKTPWPSNK